MAFSTPTAFEQRRMITSEVISQDPVLSIFLLLNLHVHAQRHILKHTH